MTSSHDEFSHTLKEAGQSVTTARQLVFASLQHQEPLSMLELVGRCPQVDRASVYRTVTLFERLGILQRLQHGWKYKLELSDAYHDHHHHATCVRCGRSTSLPENIALEAAVHKLAETYGFQLQQHQLELQGVCQRCQKVALV